MAYNIFVSHSWNYGDQYNSLIQLLSSVPYFDFKDYSVPKNDPIHNAPYDWQLEEAIKRQMAPASCVIILGGVYSTYSKWINKEIKLAKEGFYIPKKIIAVAPWGAEHLSVPVVQAADEVVRWQASSIVDAIRRNCQ